MPCSTLQGYARTARRRGAARRDLVHGELRMWTNARTRLGGRTWCGRPHMARTGSTPSRPRTSGPA